MTNYNFGQVTSNRNGLYLESNLPNPVCVRVYGVTLRQSLSRESAYVRLCVGLGSYLEAVFGQVVCLSVRVRACVCYLP